MSRNAETVSVSAATSAAPGRTLAACVDCYCCSKVVAIRITVSLIVLLAVVFTGRVTHCYEFCPGICLSGLGAPVSYVFGVPHVLDDDLRDWNQKSRIGPRPIHSRSSTARP